MAVLLNALLQIVFAPIRTVKRFIMPIAVHPTDTWDFTFPEDKEEYDREMERHLAGERSEPPQEPAVFTLRPIALKDWTRIEDDMARVNAKSGELTAKTATRAVEVIRLGLIGWKNFRYRNGEDAEFLTTTQGTGKSLLKIPREETIALLPADARRELAEEILRGNRPTPVELGNSPSPTPSQ